MKDAAKSLPRKNVRALVVISGRVQGVGYRFWTMSQAVELGLVGCVRNLSDGRVEAVLEGEQGEVEKLVDRFKLGPSNARVADVDVLWGEYTGDYQDFFIDRHGSN